MAGWVSKDADGRLPFAGGTVRRKHRLNSVNSVKSKPREIALGPEKQCNVQESAICAATPEIGATIISQPEAMGAKSRWMGRKALS